MPFGSESYSDFSAHEHRTMKAETSSVPFGSESYSDTTTALGVNTTPARLQCLSAVSPIRTGDMPIPAPYEPTSSVPFGSESYSDYDYDTRTTDIRCAVFSAFRQ